MVNRIITDISEFLFVSDAPMPVDAIFLPGGTYPEPPEYAAELYRRGLARWCIPSGGISVKEHGKWPGVSAGRERYSGDYTSDCGFYTDVLLQNGVPPEAILKEEQAGYTAENASLSRKLLDRRGIRLSSAMIVCRPFHARRCLLYYQMAFPELPLLVCPAPVSQFTRENWFQSREGMALVLGELERCGGQMNREWEDYLFPREKQ